MAIPNTGGGYQVGDGNVAERQLNVQNAPQTATTDATLTVAQITGGLLVASPGTSAASYTLPTVAALEAVMTNAKVDSTFDLTIINLGTSSGVVTLLVGTGWTLVGMVTLPIVTSAGSSGTFRCRKTGVGAWTAYRVS
jgi:hypothetical protein